MKNKRHKNSGTKNGKEAMGVIIKLVTSIISFEDRLIKYI